MKIEMSESEFFRVLDWIERHPEWRNVLRAEAPAPSVVPQPQPQPNAQPHFSSYAKPAQDEEDEVPLYAFGTGKLFEIPKEYAHIPPVAYVADTTGVGKAEFKEFTAQWVKNLGVEGAPQPERPELMKRLSQSPNCLRILGYVKESGGLMHACDEILCELDPVRAEFDPEAFQQSVDVAATTMCQIASIVFTDLSDLYEHRNIYRSKK